MKTPWAELCSEFWGPLVDPLYVYSIRRGDRVFQSRIRLGWTMASPESAIERYKNSIKRYERLNIEGKARIVQLDLIQAPSDRRTIATELFEFIGEDPNDATLNEIESTTKRVSNPTSKVGEEPELPDEWRSILNADDEYQELMHRLGY